MQLTIGTRTIEIYGEEKKGPLVLMHSDHGEAAEVWENCGKNGNSDFTLCGISGIDWEQDLSPWEADPVFKKAPPFKGGADAYLTELCNEILPEIQRVLQRDDSDTILAGYSLAGLFALYAGYRTDVFTGIVSASGSLWYPEFLTFAEKHLISETVKRVYFSVGDKEAKTRNPIMQTVEENTRKMESILRDQGIDTIFELNEGGHFADDALRLAKGIRWVLSITD